MQTNNRLIDFYSCIEPIDKMETCGDFSVFVEFDDYFYIAVGDVGGHGSVNVGKLATFCKEFIENNLQEPLDQTLLGLHSMENIRLRGLVLLLARVYKKTPMLEYVAIGNMVLKLVRDSKISDMEVQEGIVGYQIPTHINTHLLKCKKHDKFVMATDGLSIYNEKIRDKISQGQTAEELANRIMLELNRKHDDALCAVLTYKVSDSYFLSAKNIYQGP